MDMYICIVYIWICIYVYIIYIYISQFSDVLHKKI